MGAHKAAGTGAAALVAAVVLFVPSARSAETEKELAEVRSELQQLRGENAAMRRELDDALRTLRDVQAEVSRGVAPRAAETPPPQAPSVRLVDISFVSDVAAGFSSEREEEIQRLQFGDHDPKKRGFTLQNTELSLVGAVDPYFTGEAHIVHLLDPEGESRVEIEEAFLTTQALPGGLQLEVGHFFTEFGRTNPRHPHSWHWQDQPLILSRLFGPDGQRGPGVRLGWLTPLPWFSEIHVGAQNANGETMYSFLASDEIFDEAPIGGRPFVERDVRRLDDLVYLARWVNSWDLTENVTTALGASALFGPNATGPDGYTRIYGADLVAKWRPASQRRGWPFVVFESELMRRDYRADDAVGLPSETLQDWGLYAQALWGFVPRWAAGLRFESAAASGGASVGGTENDFLRDDRIRIAPLVAFYPSEFSRIRLQYNFDHADHIEGDDAHSLWLGFEIGMGAHPAHAF